MDVTGRIRTVTVSNASIRLADRNPRRRSITFGVGDTALSSAVMIIDDRDATTTLGFPLAFSGGMLRIKGQLASHEWNAIRLAAVDAVVGVIEEFPEDEMDTPTLSANIVQDKPV